MTIELTPEMEAIVTDRLSSGRYPSASAVIEEALQAVQERSGMGIGRQASQHADRESKARRMAELFAEVDAAGGFDFEVERDRRPPEEREPW